MTSSERGTFAILEDGAIVVGVPVGTRPEARAMIEAVTPQLMDRWREGKALVLPFPVDVDDRRARVAVARPSWSRRARDLFGGKAPIVPW